MGGAGPTIDAVGIVYAQNGVNVSSTLQSSLAPHFATVMTVNADAAPLSGRDLAAFDAVVVANHSAWVFADATGDAVGSFFDSGGRVVGMVGAFCTMLSVTGDFGDRFAFSPGPTFMSPDAPGTILEQRLHHSCQPPDELLPLQSRHLHEHWSSWSSPSRQ